MCCMQCSKVVAKWTFGHVAKAQEFQVMENVCEVTEGRTLLVITQVSSG